MTVPSTDTINLDSEVVADSEAIDNSTSSNKASTTTNIMQGRRSRGHGRSGGTKGTRGGHHGSIQVGDGVKRKADSDVSRPKLRKPRIVLPPREMSKR